MPSPSLSAENLAALERLRALFATLPDARQQGKVMHRLDEVLMTALCAMLCDCEAYTDMETFAENQLDWLRTFLQLEHGAPSHDVFRNVLMALQPEALAAILHSWCGALNGQHVAIDGKAICGTFDAAAGKCQLHVVRAWVDAKALSAGAALCAQKSNELEAIPRLLESLQLQGAVVTIDAMGCHPSIAEQIHHAGADYVITLKANQPKTLEAVETFFAAATEDQLSSYKTEDKKHGRYERRTHAVARSLEWFHKSWRWAGLRTVARIERFTLRGKSRSAARETHYYLSSLPPDPKRLAEVVRAHWAIENRCHWVLDVTFGEDDCPVRDLTAARNLSLLREMALKALRKTEPTKASMRNKRKRAAFNPNFRLCLLASLHA